MLERGERVQPFRTVGLDTVSWLLMRGEGLGQRTYRCDIDILNLLEGMAHYVGLFIAPEEGFGLKLTLFFLLFSPSIYTFFIVQLCLEKEIIIIQKYSETSTNIINQERKKSLKTKTNKKNTKFIQKVEKCFRFFF